MVEKFTAHYVFALGLSRFISCAHWILQLVDGDSFLLQVRPHRRHMPPWPPSISSMTALDDINAVLTDFLGIVMGLSFIIP